MNEDIKPDFIIEKIYLNIDSLSKLDELTIYKKYDDNIFECIISGDNSIYDRKRELLIKIKNLNYENKVILNDYTFYKNNIYHFFTISAKADFYYLFYNSFNIYTNKKITILFRKNSEYQDITLPKFFLKDNLFYLESRLYNNHFEYFICEIIDEKKIKETKKVLELDTSYAYYNNNKEMLYGFKDNELYFSLFSLNIISGEKNVFTLQKNFKYTRTVVSKFLKGKQIILSQKVSGDNDCDLFLLDINTNSIKKLKYNTLSYYNYLDDNYHLGKCKSYSCYFNKYCEKDIKLKKDFLEKYDFTEWNDRTNYLFDNQELRKLIFLVMCCFDKNKKVKIVPNLDISTIIKILYFCVYCIH